MEEVRAGAGGHVISLRGVGARRNPEAPAGAEGAADSPLEEPRYIYPPEDELSMNSYQAQKEGGGGASSLLPRKSEDSKREVLKRLRLPAKKATPASDKPSLSQFKYVRKQ